VAPVNTLVCSLAGGDAHVLISYSVYFSEDGRQITVMHVHADSASLDHRTFTTT
jgi:hypothetical protein